jgi:hypothetical protein
MLVEMGNVSTDKGVLAWDGDEDLKEGDAVYIEDENGERTPAADGDYVTGDGKTIVVVNSRVSEIRDPKAEVAPEEGKAQDPAGEIPARFVETDKGRLSWDNEDEDLRAGDAVYVTDEEGNRQPAPDGDYTTEDGKVITVKDGKVASIVDPAAEVDAKKVTRCQRIAEAFQESYDAKMNALITAIKAMGFSYPWLVEAGDEFCIAEIWNADDDAPLYYRFNIKEWTEEGTPVLENGVKVVPAYVTPEEKEASDAAFTALKDENAALKSQIETLSRTPAAKPAHEEVETAAKLAATGNKGLDRLARYLNAR